jgi:hypothetical protein
MRLRHAFRLDFVESGMTATSITGMNAVAVLALRRSIYSKQSVSRNDLADLIARGRDAGISPEYADLLSEVATDLLVHQVDPPRYIATADADWLIAKLSEGNGLSCRAEFEMLRDVMRYAVSVPPALTTFAVREVAKAILTGRRAATGGVDHVAGVVGLDDVEALRSMVFAATQGSSLHVSKESAEILFEIAHATAKSDNDPGFATFFAQAIGNYMIGAAFQGSPAREDVLRAERAFATPRPFGGVVAQMAEASTLQRISGLRQELQSVEEMEDDAYAKGNKAYMQDIQSALQVSAGGADWVAAHLTRAGELSPAEKKLMNFLSQEAATMPASLKALIDKAA